MEKIDKEAQRYAAVQSQIKDLQNAATNDRNPMTAMLRALLCAELHTKNEQTHQRAIQESLEKPEDEQL